MNVRYRLSSILFCAALVSACAPANPGGDTQSVTTASTSTTGSSLSGSATGAPGSATSDSAGDSASTARPEGSTRCCTPFCKFPGGACPNPDQECVQYFDPMNLPPNDPWLDIGYCGVPG